MNEELEAEAERESGAPTAAPYRLWCADNLAREARYGESLRAFDRVTAIGEGARPLVEGVDVLRIALHHKAQAAAHAGDLDESVRAFRELADRVAEPESALHDAGRVLELAGRTADAADLYQSAISAASRRGEVDADAGAEQARRALARLEDRSGRFFPGVAKLADRVRMAIRDRDEHAARALISTTHFSTGVAGGHMHFDREVALDRFCAELRESRVEVNATIVGSGAKRYMFSSGWKGDWFQGDVGFILTRCGRGWEWTGLALTVATDAWQEHWGLSQPRSNQALTLPIKAPWPAGQRFMAGGLDDFALKSAAVAAGGLLGGAAIAWGFSRASCGYGPRGFYYNSVSPTHQDEDAFAIDFTRYRRGAPFDNESGGTPVLAVADGVVMSACAGTSSGDDSSSNTVEIRHDDPATGQPRYLSRYLHLAGPFQLSVSSLMAVDTGMRLGLMNDTGNSILDHLHFSIHDQTVPFAGAGSTCGGITRGASVRPSPMDGQRLGDGDSGKCVRSSNAEVAPTGVVTGRITMLRSHELGSGFGPPQAFLDTETIVQLDATPDVSYGMPLRHGEALPSHRSLLTLLRQAFTNDRTVRIEHARVGAADLRIFRVELRDEENDPASPSGTFGGFTWPVFGDLDN